MDINSKSKDGKTPLMICASKGCSDLVRLLLERGAKINLTDNSNKTALIYAIESDNGENSNIVSMILENNADFNILTSKNVKSSSKSLIIFL